MDPVPAMIVAKSESQAMDWSLVLASQGIGATIERPGGEGPWILLTEPTEFKRALVAVRLYEAENGARFWQQKVPGTTLIWDARGLVWFVFLAALFGLDCLWHEPLTDAGIMRSLPVGAGAWWSLFTATTLHADLAHLLSNAVVGTLFLGLAIGRFGSGAALLASCLAGAMGNVPGWIWHGPNSTSLGASGMVMGALGLLTTQSVGLLRHGLRAREVIIPGIFGGVLLLILLGLSPSRRVDVLAHVVGFLCGAMFGAILSFVPEHVVRNFRVNRFLE